MIQSCKAREENCDRELLDASQPRRHSLVSWRFRKTNGAALALSSLQEHYVADVNGRIASGQYRMEHDSCPCGAEDAFVISQVDRYGIALDTVLCTTCGTLRFDPYLSAESLADFYRVYYQDMYARAPDPDAYFTRQRGYGERMMPLVRNLLPAGATVAEVGCGAGGALSVFREAGYEPYGCDYSARLIEFGTNKGLENLHCGDIEALIGGMSAVGKKADLIVLHHVFEHLPSPAAWLVRTQYILADNGAIVIAVPDVTGIHRYPSPNGDLRLFLHIAHKFNFSLAGLAALANRVGLKASLVDVEKSNQAPELWVAFARDQLPVDELELVSGGANRALLRRLQLIELDYVRRGALRKLRKAAGVCAHALGTWLPNRGNRS